MYAMCFLADATVDIGCLFYGTRQSMPTNIDFVGRTQLLKNIWSPSSSLHMSCLTHLRINPNNPRLV